MSFLPSSFVTFSVNDSWQTSVPATMSTAQLSHSPSLIPAAIPIENDPHEIWNPVLPSSPPALPILQPQPQRPISIASFRPTSPIIPFKPTPPPSPSLISSSPVEHSQPIADDLIDEAETFLYMTARYLEEEREKKERRRTVYHSRVQRRSTPCTTRQWRPPLKRNAGAPINHPPKKRRLRSPSPVASGSKALPIVVNDDPIPPSPVCFDLTEEARPIFPQKVHGKDLIRTNLAAISIKKHKYQLLEIRAREALGLGPFEVGSIKEREKMIELTWPCDE